MSDQTSLTLLVIGLFIVVFPLFWCAIVLLLSWMGGWQKLAADYATDKEPRGTAFKWITGMVGVTSYRNCLTVHVAPEGLFLSLPIFFRVGHKPLLIPWRAIHDEKPLRIFWYEAVRFEVGTPTIATVTVPGKVMAEREAVHR